MSEDKIQAAIQWLQQQAATIRFGEVHIELTIHDGTIKRIERGIVIKEQ